VALTAKAELAALKPNSEANDVVRLDGVAARARRAWDQVVRAERHKPLPSLQELMGDAL
jgi:hypothetical protein